MFGLFMAIFTGACRGVAAASFALAVADVVTFNPEGYYIKLAVGLALLTTSTLPVPRD